MMVIKEEKNWSPILDMDMVKHMVSSSQLYLVAFHLYHSQTIFLEFQETISITPFCASYKAKMTILTLTLALKFPRDNIISPFQFQAIFTKSKIRPCITFDGAKKPSTRNCPYFVFILVRCQDVKFTYKLSHSRFLVGPLFKAQQTGFVIIYFYYSNQSVVSLKTK